MCSSHVSAYVGECVCVCFFAWNSDFLSCIANVVFGAKDFDKLRLVVINVALHDLHAWSQQAFECSHLQDYKVSREKFEKDIIQICITDFKNSFNYLLLLFYYLLLECPHAQHMVSNFQLPIRYNPYITYTYSLACFSSLKW